MGFHLYRMKIARCAEAGGSFLESFANFVGEPRDTVARCSGNCEGGCVYIRERRRGGVWDPPLRIQNQQRGHVANALLRCAGVCCWGVVGGAGYGHYGCRGEGG